MNAGQPQPCYDIWSCAQDSIQNFMQYEHALTTIIVAIIVMSLTFWTLLRLCRKKIAHHTYIALLTSGLVAIFTLGATGVIIAKTEADRRQQYEAYCRSLGPDANMFLVCADESA